MLRQIRWALVIPVVCAGVALARGQDGKDVPKSQEKAGEAEVRFGDGSLLRITILQPAVEVMTKYGKLSVPVEEIRQIEFGVHLTDAVRQKVETAISNLGSKTYKEREGAVRDLVQLGALAYPQVQAAAQGTDEETVKRATLALQAIRAKVPAEYLRPKVDDLIETAEFPVIGRIMSPTLKARTAYFGDVDLRLPELRQIRFTAGIGDAEVLVDASRFGSGQNVWMDTGITVPERSRLRITVTGQIDLWPQTPGQYMTTAKGFGGAVRPGTSSLPGTLMGKIGENGTPFQIGEAFEGMPTESGKLYFHIIPSPWNNASTGSYRATVNASLTTGFRR